MNSKMLKSLLLATALFVAPSTLCCTVTQAQDSSFNIEMELPEGSAEFGSEEFSINSNVTEEEAAGAAAVAAMMSAVCTGIPALLLGLVIGYFIGKSRTPKPTS